MCLEIFVVVMPKEGLAGGVLLSVKAADYKSIASVIPKE